MKRKSPIAKFATLISNQKKNWSNTSRKPTEQKEQCKNIFCYIGSKNNNFLGPVLF